MAPLKNRGIMREKKETVAILLKAVFTLKPEWLNF
jgi:hypothetical protein